MASYSSMGANGEDAAFLGSSPMVFSDANRQSKLREILDWVVDEFRDRPVRSCLVTIALFFIGAGAYTQLFHHSVSTSKAKVPYPKNDPTSAIKKYNPSSGKGEPINILRPSISGSKSSIPKDESQKRTDKNLFSNLKETEVKELYDAFLEKYPPPMLEHMPDSEKAEMYSDFKANLQKIDNLNTKAKDTTTYNLNKFASFNAKQLDNLKGYYAFEDDKFTDRAKKYWHDDATSHFGFNDYYYDYFDMFFEELSGYVQYDDDKFCGACGRFPELEEATLDNVPDEFDWRQYGAVTEVQDQCHCGAGYAFAVADNVASAWFLARHNHHLQMLSPQYLASCDYYTYGCMGGWFSGTFSFIHDMGIFSESNYPFDSQGGRAGWCKGDMVDSIPPAATITSWSWIPHHNEEQLKLALVKNGPLVVGVNANNLEFYESGVDTGANCDDESEGIDHAMLLIGWGMTDEGIEHWIVKNSWGKDWGNEGYWYPIIGSNVCSITHKVMTAFA